MFPILFHFNSFSLFGIEFDPIEIFSHGVFSAIGFMIAIAWFLRMSQKNHMHLEFIADHFFSFVFSSIIGARLGYVFVFFARYQEDPLSMLYLWDGGYLFWTGIICFILTLFYHCQKQKEKIGQWLDVIMPSAIIVFIFDAFGSFLGGSNYGKPTELAWGIMFENPEVPYTIAIHPVQLYVLFSLLLLLGVIYILHKSRMRESLIGLVSLNLYALISLLTEYYRGDEMIIYFDFRFTQVLQLVVFVFSLMLIFLSNSKNR